MYKIIILSDLSVSLQKRTFPQVEPLEKYSSLINDGSDLEGGTPMKFRRRMAPPEVYDVYISCSLGSGT